MSSMLVSNWMTWFASNESIDGGGGKKHAQHVRPIGRIGRTCPVSHGTGHHRRKPVEGLGQGGQQSYPGWRGQFYGGASGINRIPFCQFGNRGSGNRQKAMCPIDRSGPDVDGRGAEGLHPQFMTSEQPAHDIDQGIDGPHFMKRNSGGIVSMHRSFCRGQAFEDRKRLFFDLRW